MNKRSKALKIFVPILILAAGAAAMLILIAGRPEPRKAPPANPGALVETLTVERTDHPVRVHGTGTVRPRRQVEITPQVGGTVVETVPELVAGGFFREGQLLFRIEDADYRLAVDRARATLAKAKYELATVESQARVARTEWERLDLADGEEPNPLVLYEPQLKNAEAALLSARAALEQARLDLGRTEVRAPFDSVVRSEAVDTGQYLRPGNPVAVLAGTGRAEIVVPLPLEDLQWLQIPRSGGSGEGSAATVTLRAGERRQRWPGRIVRALGEVDPEGRMARLVVAVDDPYGLAEAAGGGLDLAVGTFVEVALHGATLEDVAVLPAGVLRDGDQVWIMQDRQLKFRPVEVLRRARDTVVIGAGLDAGERVVLSNVAGAAEGMKLRPVAEPDAAAEVPARPATTEAAQ